MKSFGIIATSLLSVASAANVKLCKDQNQGGQCTTINAVGCTNFPGGFNDKVSSVGTGGATCTFFVDGSCGGGSWVAKGRHNTIPANFNDRLSSVSC